MNLSRKLIEAGYYNTEWAKFYFPAKVLVLGLISGLCFASGDMTSTNKLLVVIVSLIVVIVVPDTLLQVRRKILIRKTSSQLPYLLGHDVSMCTNRYDYRGWL